MTEELQPMKPEDGVESYLEHRRREGLRESTLQSHRYRLEAFEDWCRDKEITNLNTLTGRDIQEYAGYRRDEDNLKPVTLQGQLSTLKKAVEYWSSIEATPQGLSDKIHIPTLSHGEISSDTELPLEQAFELQEYLRRYRWASREHTLYETGFHTGMRLGGLRALDLQDIEWEYTDDDVVEAAYIEVRHRPDQDTPLKNGLDGERDVVVTQKPAWVLREYIDVNRIDVTDDYGREPVFTTGQGRIAAGSIRQTFYDISRPCHWKECPHGRELDTCEAAAYDAASLCPSSYSPHPVRRASITYQLLSDINPDVVAERVNSTRDTIQRHYDRRTLRQRAKQRKQELEKL